MHDSGLSFRHERYPAYKATREKLTEELQADFDRGMERIRAILDANRIPILALQGYEADDVIGTLAKQGVEAGMNVVVVSGDKDFQQLVRPGVWLLNPGRGGPASVEEQWVGVENGSERLGVPPALVTDYLALVGDSSDNVPGVKGIGEKTAQELVNSYGTVENILAHAAELTKKRPREALLEQREMALLSKELVTIRNDLPVTLDLDAMRLSPPDYGRLRTLYVELEFHSAREDHRRADSGRAVGVGGVRRLPRRARRSTPPSIRSRRSTRRLNARAARRTSRSTSETLVDPAAPHDVDPLRSTLVGLTIAVGPGEAYYFPLAHRERADGRRATSALGDELALRRRRQEAAREERPASRRASRRRALARRRARRSGTCRRSTARSRRRSKRCSRTRPSRRPRRTPSTIMLVLRVAGVTLRGLDFDTMVASYVLDPGPPLARARPARARVSRPQDDEPRGPVREGQGRSSRSTEVPVECARDYSCEDADVDLAAARAVRAAARDAAARARSFTMSKCRSSKCSPRWNGAASRSTSPGSPRSRSASSASDDVSSRRSTPRPARSSTSTPTRSCARSCSRSSNLPVLKKTATGASTDASVLQQLADEGHPLPVAAHGVSRDREAREHVHRRAAALRASADRAACTRRSARPSPRRGACRRATRIFRTSRFAASSAATFGAASFRDRIGRSSSADYSQIELRLLAHLSGDPAFVHAFQSGGDIHRQTAALIFDVPARSGHEGDARAREDDQLRDDLRAGRARAVAPAQDRARRGEGVHRTILPALSSRARVPRLDGRVRARRTATCRRSSIAAGTSRSCATGTSTFGRSASGRPQNSPIQGSAADLIKVAMIRIQRALESRQLQSKMLLQVHDELVFEAPQSELEELSALVKHEMEHAANSRGAPRRRPGVGDNWLATKMEG